MTEISLDSFNQNNNFLFLYLPLFNKGLNASGFRMNSQSWKLLFDYNCILLTPCLSVGIVERVNLSHLIYSKE